MIKVTLLLLSTAALMACGDKQQTAATPTKDAAPYAGTGVACFHSFWLESWR